MNPSREELLSQLARSKPAAKRAAWLDAECIGGVVYVAEQTERVRRRVALQVIELNRNTQTVSPWRPA